MSTVLVVTPIIVANWPVITAAITAAVGTMGFALAQENAGASSERSVTREEIELEESEILDAAQGTQEEIVVRKGDVRAVFTRDARGCLRVCMEGKNCSKAQLRRMGEELIGSVTQQYVYHRVMTELKARNMTVVDEEVTEDRSVKIRVRNW